MTKVGLVILSLRPRALPKLFTKAVLPDPKSPRKAKTVAVLGIGWLGFRKLTISEAKVSISFKLLIVFFISLILTLPKKLTEVKPFLRFKV